MLKLKKNSETISWIKFLIWPRPISPFLIIAETIFPNIRNLLKEHKIGYIDLNGNMNIEADNFLLKIEGNHKKNLHPVKYGRAFTKAGLKTILLFLLNEEKINDTYREIAKNTGIAIGNVKLILDGLIEEGFVLRKNDKELKLTNKKRFTSEVDNRLQ